MMPNGPPAKLVTLNTTQANPAANARDTFVIVTPPHRAPREECYHRLYSGPAEMGPMVGLSAMSPAHRICEEKSHSSIYACAAARGRPSAAAGTFSLKSRSAVA